MSENCNLDFIKHFREAVGKEAVDGLTKTLKKATSGMSPEEVYLMTNEIVQDALNNMQNSASDMSALVDYRNKVGNAIKFQEQRTQLFKHMSQSRADHYGSATNLAKTMFEKGEATGNDLKMLARQLPEIDVDDIREALRVATSEEDFIDHLDEISGTFSKESYMKPKGAHYAFMEILQKLDSNVQQRVRMFEHSFQEIEHLSADIQASLLSPNKFNKTVDDLFDNWQEGKFTTELGTAIYEYVLKPITVRANESLHYVTNPLHLVFNAGVADPSAVTSMPKDTFVEILRSSIIDDPREALRRMGVPLNVAMRQMDLNPSEYLSGKKPIPYSEILTRRLEEIYDKLSMGDQFEYAGPHVDLPDTSAYLELAQREVLPQWNVTGGTSPLLVVPWKDGAAFRNYAERFGTTSDLSDTFRAQTLRLARNIGLAETFGTHPEVTFKTLKKEAIKAAQDASDTEAVRMLQGKLADTVKGAVQELELPALELQKVTALRQKRSKLQTDFYDDTISDADATALSEKIKAIDEKIRNIENTYVEGIQNKLNDLKERRNTVTSRKESAKLTKQIKDLEKKLVPTKRFSEQTDLLRGVAKASRLLFSGNVDHYFDAITGKSAHPLDRTLSTGASLIRTTLSAMLLPFSGLMALPDFAPRATVLAPFDTDGNFITTRTQIIGGTLMDLMFGGEGILANISRIPLEGLQPLWKGLYEYTTGKPYRGKLGRELTEKLRSKTSDYKARQMASQYAGIALDMANDSKDRLFYLYEGASGMLRNFLDIGIRSSGLAQMDTSGRILTANIVSKYFGKVIREGFKEMDAFDVNRFKHYGITSSDLKKARPYVREVDGAERLIMADLKRSGNDELYMKFSRMYYDIDRNATPIPGAKQRSMVSQGTQAGTIPGEIMKAYGVFKSFQNTMTQEVIPYVLQNTRLGAGNMKFAALLPLMAEGMAYAALGLWLKAYAKGEEPPELNERFIVELMLRTGVLSIYGDILLQEQDHYHTFSKTLIGPVPGFVDDLTATATNAKTRERIAKRLLLVGSGTGPLSEALLGDTVEMMSQLFDAQTLLEDQ